MAAAKYHSASSPFLGHLFQESFSSTTRKRNGGTTVSIKKAKLSESNVKKANLSARKKERVKLPDYGDAHGGNSTYHISKFFSHPSGIEAILNRRALQSCQSMDSNVYRCMLPVIQFFSFEVAPVLDLQVTPTSDDCIVEMLSCKFEGSEVMERQNERFSAFMKNHIKWIYTQPFTMLPVSAVEGPGNLMMQALVDQLVPLLVQQLLQDYEDWVRAQTKHLLK
ncbi:uncharacterized protein [Henckelia pumila]|uniref:uncharacterized protein isoform X2 n=1 Tax=Henckelia pumila TaxID=405737 RepID=UPI003C6E2399